MENTSVQRGLFLTFRLFPLIRPGLRPVHLPRGGRLPPGEGAPLPSPGGRCRRSGGRGAVPGWFWVPPHTRQGFALPPSPRRGFFPSSVPGCARSTFPVGEGFLRRGSLTFPVGEGFLPARAFPYLPLGEGAAAAAEEGRYRVGSGSGPTPVRASPCHPLPGEGFSLIRPGLRPVHLPRRGRLPPARAFPYLSFGFSNIFSVYPLYESSIVL